MAPSGATEHSPETGPRRPRSVFVGAAVTGTIGGAFFTVASVRPDLAPYLAGVGIFLGVAIGALLLGRARNSDLVGVLSEEEEQSADRHWELRDIAEHYRQNSDGRRRAEAANAAKSHFLATVSHELRTPLSGVLGLSNVLLETSLTPEQETFSRAIRSSGELMLGLVDDMLDFAKIEAGRFDLVPVATETEPYLEDVAELFFSRAEAKGLDLATYVDPATPTAIFVDPARLRQVLINLVGNALKFTAVGGVAMKVGPVNGDRQRVRFAVEDTGPGVPPELADRIFDEFERAAADPDSRYSGSGLGLAIAQRIVQQMGSVIKVEDRRGGGSVFSFVLSLPAAASNAPPKSGELIGKRALILAPAGLAPPLLARQLEAEGAAVRIADNLNQAAALAGAAEAAGEGYDLLLLDQRLVEETASALATIREAAGTRLPTAIMIETGRRRSAEQLHADGFDAYLVRPIRRRSLVRIATGLAKGDGKFGSDPSDLRSQPTTTPRSRVGRHILVAEDDEINALLLRAILQRLGHHVTEVSDGAAALDLALSRPFDAILLDLGLPEMTGLEVAKAIRKAERESGGAVAILTAITADARPESRDAALAAGFDGFLQKPPTAAQLSEIFSEARTAVDAA